MKIYILTLESCEDVSSSVLIGVFDSLEQALDVGESERNEDFYPLVTCSELNKNMEKK